MSLEGLLKKMFKTVSWFRKKNFVKNDSCLQATISKINPSVPEFTGANVWA